jgi:hypothetical protein
VRICGLGVRGESTLLSILDFPLPSTKFTIPIFLDSSPFSSPLWVTPSHTGIQIPNGKVKE